jgi:hypothetical protein
MIDLNFEIFDGKSFKDLCKDIVTRSENKKDQLDTLISDIRTQIADKNDVQMFMPRIKELLEVGVKNDEQIVKLIAVVQRLQSTQLEASGGDAGGLSEEDKEQLMRAKVEELKGIEKEVKTPVPDLTQVK